MKIIFDGNAKKNDSVNSLVQSFLVKIDTLEKTLDLPIVIFQDGINDSYYIKCNISAAVVAPILDLNAKLTSEQPNSFRANRELLLTHKTYLKMEGDAQNGREFNDIIIEYNTDYQADKPLKIWGGQHRSKAIINATNKSNRYHGFRIFFNLTPKQRTELALISNTNISVSNDTFDRMLEETVFGSILRDLFIKVGFLNKNEDFPDVGSKSEKITVKLGRSFIVNYYLGKQKSEEINSDDLDKNYYEPYLVETGVIIDERYKEVMEKHKTALLQNEDLVRAGKEFHRLHKAQHEAVKTSKVKITNKKGFRNKALIESVLCGWSYVAGLLQNNKKRLDNHYTLPKTTPKIPDPLNAQEMSKYKHDSDQKTYRGLGTRSSPKDRQRIAQLFLAKSLEKDIIIDRKFMDSAVSQVVGLQTMNKGYKK